VRGRCEAVTASHWVGVAHQLAACQPGHPGYWVQNRVQGTRCRCVEMPTPGTGGHPAGIRPVTGS
jgi:hypothetical protein